MTINWPEKQEIAPQDPLGAIEAKIWNLTPEEQEQVWRLFDGNFDSNTEIDKVIVGNQVNQWPKEIILEDLEYTTNLLSIRNMGLWDYQIPTEYSTTIIQAINNLWDFQKLKIIWCTDATPISTPHATQQNQAQFEQVRAKYMAAGGECPDYQQLLNSTEDPQNVILWYTRAMNWVLSLNLNPDQMQKVEVWYKLSPSQQEKKWYKDPTEKLNPQERWFDIAVDYKEAISREIETLVYQDVYKILWELSNQHLTPSHNSVNRDIKFYQISELKFSTHDAFQQIYQRVYRWVKQIVWDNPELENKAREQTQSYLQNLIYACGWVFQSWVRSPKTISDKLAYMLYSIKQWNLSQQDFRQLTEYWDISILENKQLKNWQNLSEFLQNSGAIWVDKVSLPSRRYLVPDNHPDRMYPKRRDLEVSDYNLLWLYFELKKSKIN